MSVSQLERVERRIYRRQNQYSEPAEGRRYESEFYFDDEELLRRLMDDPLTRGEFIRIHRDEVEYDGGVYCGECVFDGERWVPDGTGFLEKREYVAQASFHKGKLEGEASFIFREGNDHFSGDLTFNFKEPEGPDFETLQYHFSEVEFLDASFQAGACSDARIRYFGGDQYNGAVANNIFPWGAGELNIGKKLRFGVFEGFELVSGEEVTSNFGFQVTKLKEREAESSSFSQFFIETLEGDHLSFDEEGHIQGLPDLTSPDVIVPLRKKTLLQLLSIEAADGAYPTNHLPFLINRLAAFSYKIDVPEYLELAKLLEGSLSFAFQETASLKDFSGGSKLFDEVLGSDQEQTKIVFPIGVCGVGAVHQIILEVEKLEDKKYHFRVFDTSGFPHLEEYLNKSADHEEGEHYTSEENSSPVAIGWEMEFQEPNYLVFFLKKLASLAFQPQRPFPSVLGGLYRFMLSAREDHWTPTLTGECFIWRTQLAGTCTLDSTLAFLKSNMRPEDFTQFMLDLHSEGLEKFVFDEEILDDLDLSPEELASDKVERDLASIILKSIQSIEDLLDSRTTRGNV